MIPTSVDIENAIRSVQLRLTQNGKTPDNETLHKLVAVATLFITSRQPDLIDVEDNRLGIAKCAKFRPALLQTDCKRRNMFYNDR